MTASLSARLDRIVETLPRAYPGPGGAIAVLRDGEVLVRHAWGWANAERRIPFTPRTLFRMCSITKQFTCAVVLDAFPDPSVLDGDVRARLPLLRAAGAGRAASVPQPVRPARLLGGGDAARLAGRGAVRRHRGRPRDRRHADAAVRARHPPLLRQPELPHPVGHRAGAHRPQLRRAAAHPRLRTRRHGHRAAGRRHRAMPDGTQGYEGTPTGGFRAAENRILWTGDAGLGASPRRHDRLGTPHRRDARRRGRAV